MNKKLKQEIAETLQRAFNESRIKPDQFVVAYFRKEDDSLIGYHASTWCNYTDDILEAKRYSSENPYPQMATISKNLKHVIAGEIKEGDFFGEVMKKIREAQWTEFSPEDVYMDAIYLAPGTPLQEFRMTLIEGEQFREF